MKQSTTALRQLLELLDRGAPTERLLDIAAQARANGTAPAELAEVERAVEAALRVRRTLSDHHRRESRLTALFDTASDLAGLRDTDAVLRSIVHRARMLLNTDVAYLSLNDLAAGRTYMKVTDGSASALFQQVILGMGEGLGGLVAQTARPYATADYNNDPRFNHTTPIDTSVQDEGLVAILGVPLKVGNRILGVLYAADRSSRDFSAEEVALLGSLAAHAAIALDTARLLEETHSALVELGQANETIRAHNEAMRRAEESHDRLTELVVSGGDIAAVAAALADVLGGGIVVHDAHGVELARVGTKSRPQPAEAVAASKSTGRAVADGSNWVSAVLAGPEVLGSIVLAGRAELADADRRLFERASVVTALLLLLRRSVAETEDRVRGELLSDLLAAPDRDPAGLLARGRRVGIHLDAPHAVAVLHADTERRRLASAAIRFAPRKALAGVHAEQVVLLVPGEQPTELAARLARELTAELGCAVTVGAAGPAGGPPALADAHAEAARCLQALVTLGRTGSGAAQADLGFLGVVLGDRANVADFVTSTLRPVLDYDERRGTQLARTLHAYFDADRNLTRTKDELHVHVNTVVQRLDRITSLLGEGWQAPDRALEIQLALRLRAITTAPR